MSGDAATPSHEKDNFIRLSSLLVDGGTKLLREVLNDCLRPDTLHAVLAKPKTKTELKKARLFPDQEKQLYPPGGGCVTSEDFDITLLCKLLRHLCSLTPPASGWGDKLPNVADTNKADDLVRIRIYRNEAIAHIKEMKLDDGEFQRLYFQISSAMVRLAKSISSDKETEWKIVTEQYLSGPITSKELDCVEQLNTWYENEKELKEEMRAGFVGVEGGIKDISQKLEEIKDLVGNKQGGYSDPSPRMRPDLSQKKRDCDDTRAISKVSIKVWKEGTPTFKELDNVARNVMDCWQPLGRELGVPQSAIDNIQLDNVNYSAPRQKAFRMLQVWRDKGRSSTYAQLGKALCNEGKESIAEDYCQG